VSVQEMVADGVEVIIGVNCDPQLGRMLLFGSGGVMADALEPATGALSLGGGNRAV